jgi:uncharacterized protein DUF1566
MKFLRWSVGIFTVLVCSLWISVIMNLRAAPRAGGVTAQQNGDVNCDGKLDISDAIALLVHLFQDGSAPCAIAQEALPCCTELSQKLDRLIELASGRCEDRDDRLESILVGQDLVTVDHCTGLMWLGGPLGADIDLDGHVDTLFNYNQLTNVIKNFSYAGFQDWRLPTAVEIQSLMRLFAGIPYDAQNGVPGFQIQFDATYRTSTKFGDDSGTHYAAYFASKGQFSARSDQEKLSALLVRNPQ